MAYWRSTGEQLYSTWNMPSMSNACGRCGVVYAFTHHCKALTRKCLYCDQYGHYVQCCQKRESTFWNRAVGASCAASCTGKKTQQQHGKKSSKSPSKHQRDIRRYVTFHDRKSVCVAMPFYQVSDSELPKLLPKSAHIGAINFATINKQISAARSEVSKLQDERASLQIELAGVNTELPKLKASVSQLTSTVETAQIKMLELQNENNKLEKTVSLLRTCVADEQRSRRKIEKEARLTAESFEKLKSSVDHDHAKVLQEKSALTETNDRLLDEVEQHKSLKYACEKDLNEVISNNESLKKQLKAVIVKFQCVNCGQGKHSHPTQCTAFWHVCQICKNVGHFESEHHSAIANFKCPAPEHCVFADYHHPYNCDNHLSLFRGGRRTPASLNNSCPKCACEKRHSSPENCPSKWTECRRCGNVGHFTIQCPHPVQRSFYIIK